MDTRFLQTFLTIVRTGSAAETARRMNITPSAVSQRIRALEAEIGQPLLQRHGQRLRPSAAAEAIMIMAERMLALEDDLRAAASVDGASGLLRVGVIQTALTGIMPDILLALRQNRPGIDLYLVPGASGDLWDQLSAGALDLAVLVKPHFPLPKSYDWLTLRRERHLLIAPPGTPAAPTEALLAEFPFLRYDRNHWGGRAVEQYLRAQQLQPRDGHELDSLEAIMIMVSRGLGVSIIPDWPAPWPAGVPVESFPLADAPLREVGVLWSRSAGRLPLIRSFLQEARPS